MAQIGVKKIAHGGLVYEVPIYETTDVARPFKRVWVDGQVGALPFFPVSEGPEYDWKRVFHDGEVWGLHSANSLYVEVDLGSYNTNNYVYVDNGKLKAYNGGPSMAFSSSQSAEGGFDTILNPDGTPSNVSGALRYDGSSFRVSGTSGYKITNGNYQLSTIKYDGGYDGDIVVRSGIIQLKYTYTSYSTQWKQRKNQLAYIGNEGSSGGGVWDPPTGGNTRNHKIRMIVYGSGDGDTDINARIVADTDRNGIGDKVKDLTNNDGNIDQTWGSMSLSKSEINSGPGNVYAEGTAYNPTFTNSNSTFDYAKVWGVYQKKETVSSTNTGYRNVTLIP